MRGAQVPQMRARHNANAADGQDRFAKAMPNRKRRRHQRQAERTKQERRGTAMPGKARTQSECADGDSKS